MNVDNKILKIIFYLPGFEHTNYAIVNFPDDVNKRDKKSTFTFASANALLGVEIIGKFQNMELVRILLILCEKFSKYSSS